MLAWIDGRFVASGDLPRPDAGRLAPFETMGACDAQVPLWGLHLQRLDAAAARVGLTCATPPELRAAAGELLLESAHADGILRLQLVPVGDITHTVMTSRLRSPASTVKLLPTVVQRSADGPPGDLKAAPRTFYDRVLQQAQDGGADDGIVVDEHAQVLETATANLWLLLDGVWVTPALDGRVLPGIARALLLAGGASSGTAMAEEDVTMNDLHRASAIAVSNAVYGPRPASLYSGAPAAVELVEGSLQQLWREMPVRG